MNFLRSMTVILSLSVISLYPQSRIDEYMRFLPAAFSDSSHYTEMISKNLKAAAATDPELIYEYLLCFDPETGEFNTKQYQNFLKRLSIRKRDRSAWAQSEIRRLENSSMEYSLISRSSAYYEGLLQEDVREQTVQPMPGFDSNKRDFIVYQFMTRDTLLQYDPVNDYSVKRALFEYTFVDSFQNFCEQFTTEPDTTACGKLVKEIPGSWYMFERAGKRNAGSFSPSELVKVYVQQKYSFEEPPVSYGAGLVMARQPISGVWIQLADNPYGTVVTEQSFRAEQYGLAGFFRYQLKPVKSLFSYVKCDAFFSAVSRPIERRSVVVSLRMYEIDLIYLQHQQTFTAGTTFTVNSMFSTGFTVATPLFYFHEDVHLELAAGAAVDHFTYQHRYTYSILESMTDRYSRYKEIKSSGEPARQAAPVTKNQLRVLGSFDLVVNIFGGFYLQYSVGLDRNSFYLQKYF